MSPCVTHLTFAQIVDFDIMAYILRDDLYISLERTHDYFNIYKVLNNK